MKFHLKLLKAQENPWEKDWKVVWQINSFPRFQARAPITKKKQKRQTYNFQWDKNYLVHKKELNFQVPEIMMINLKLSQSQQSLWNLDLDKEVKWNLKMQSLFQALDNIRQTLKRFRIQRLYLDLAPKKESKMMLKD